MPRWLVLALIPMLVIASGPAHAGAINLRWNACWGDGGTMNRVFSCNTNSGTNTLVASFVPAHDYANVTEIDASIVFATSATSLPPWWEFHTAGSCRQNSLNVSPAPPPDAVNCEDWSGGGALSLISSYLPDRYGPGMVSMAVASATPAGTSVPLVHGHEYFVVQVLMNDLKTVGTGACSGCELGACFAILNFKVITTTTSTSEIVGVQYYESDDRMVTWQGGAGVVQVTQGQIMSCPRATPTRGATWSRVKSLYR